MKSKSVTRRDYSYAANVISALKKLTPEVVRILIALEERPHYTRELYYYAARSLGLSEVLDFLEKLKLIRRRQMTLKDLKGPKYPEIPIIVNELTPKGKLLLSLLKQLINLLEGSEG